MKNLKFQIKEIYVSGFKFQVRNLYFCVYLLKKRDFKKFINHPAARRDY